jgi:hypothetical protein
MLTPADLRGMRSSAGRLLRGGFSIHDVTRTLDRYGKATFSYPLLAEVRALLEATSGSERSLLATFTDDGVLRVESARLKLPYGTAITTEQVVRTPDGRTWDVAHIGSDSLAAFSVVLLTLREAS